MAKTKHVRKVVELKGWGQCKPTVPAAELQTIREIGRQVGGYVGEGLLSLST